MFFVPEHVAVSTGIFPTSTVQMTGNWGCLANFADMAAGKAERKCDVFQVQATESSIAYKVKSESNMYVAFTDMKINRYTGVFTATSKAVARPEAKAKWGLLEMETSAECAVPCKKF